MYLSRLFFFFNTDTGQMNILGIPMFSVIWLGFRGNLLTSVSGLVVTWVAGLGVALSESLEALFLMRGLETGIFYSSFSTSTKNSLVLCSLIEIFVEVRWLFIAIGLMTFGDGSHYVSTKVRKCIFKRVWTTWKLYGNRIQFACVCVYLGVLMYVCVHKYSFFHAK